MELNYQAGIFVGTLAQLALAYHISVQCFNTDYADIISAVLLIAACMDEHLDLANIELDNEAATKNAIYNFLCMKGANDKMFDLSSSSEDLYQSEMDERVKLHCFCLTPWIDRPYFLSQTMSWVIVELNFPAHHLKRHIISSLIKLMLLHVQQTLPNSV